jgi:hypothetical protein
MSDKGEEEETHAMGVLEMQEELLRLERQRHETEIAMKSVQPIIQVNLQVGSWNAPSVLLLHNPFYVILYAECFL